MATANETKFSDFPSSDLLKALQAHAGDMYAGRGLMSTESRPKDEEGKRLPSMIQAMDGSALIALGDYFQKEQSDALSPFLIILWLALQVY